MQLGKIVGLFEKQESFKFISIMLSAARLHDNSEMQYMTNNLMIITYKCLYIPKIYHRVDKMVFNSKINVLKIWYPLPVASFIIFCEPKYGILIQHEVPFRTVTWWGHGWRMQEKANGKRYIPDGLDISDLNHACSRTSQLYHFQK